MRRSAACLTVQGPTAPTDVTFAENGHVAAFLNKFRYRIGIGDGSNALATGGASSYERKLLVLVMQAIGGIGQQTDTGRSKRMTNGWA